MNDKFENTSQYFKSHILGPNVNIERDDISKSVYEPIQKIEYKDSDNVKIKVDDFVFEFAYGPISDTLPESLSKFVSYDSSFNKFRSLKSFRLSNNSGAVLDVFSQLPPQG